MHRFEDGDDRGVKGSGCVDEVQFQQFARHGKLASRVWQPHCARARTWVSGSLVIFFCDKAASTSYQPHTAGASFRLLLLLILKYQRVLQKSTYHIWTSTRFRAQLQYRRAQRMDFQPYD